MTQENNDQRAPSRLRARLQQSRHDTRGIALQTVIIMVVLLAIAGAVVAVLLSRTGEVTGELENADVTATTIDTEGECLRYEMRGGGKSVTGVWDASDGCTWDEADANDSSVTKGACLLVGGKFSEGDAGTDKDRCRVAPA